MSKHKPLRAVLFFGLKLSEVCPSTKNGVVSRHFFI